MLAAADGRSSNSGSQRAPLPAKLLVEHPVHVARGQCRALGLQPDQRPPVRLGQLGGHHRLVDGQRLADLHRAPRAAGRARRTAVPRCAPWRQRTRFRGLRRRPTAPSRDRTAGERQRQGGDPGRPRGGAARKPFPATGRSRCHAHARGSPAGPGPLRRRVRVPVGDTPPRRDRNAIPAVHDRVTATSGGAVSTFDEPVSRRRRCWASPRPRLASATATVGGAPAARGGSGESRRVVGARGARHGAKTPSP